MSDPRRLEDDGDAIVAAGARIRDALRADAATTGFADEIAISVVGDRAILTGRVEDLGDADAAVAVAERASGIGEVVDRLEVASIDDAGSDPRGLDPRAPRDPQAPRDPASRRA